MTARTTGTKARKKRRLFSLRYIEGTRTNRMILNAKKRNCCRISANANEDTKRKEYHASLASIERQQTPTNANTQRQIFIVTEKRKSGKANDRKSTNEGTTPTKTNERHQTTTGTKSQKERRQERQTRKTRRATNDRNDKRKAEKHQRTKDIFDLLWISTFDIKV